LKIELRKFRPDLSKRSKIAEPEKVWITRRNMRIAMGQRKQEISLKERNQELICVGKNKNVVRNLSIKFLIYGNQTPSSDSLTFLGFLLSFSHLCPLESLLYEDLMLQENL